MIGKRGLSIGDREKVSGWEKRENTEVVELSQKNLAEYQKSSRGIVPWLGGG
jgi:hypothetical protein